MNLQIRLSNITWYQHTVPLWKKQNIEKILILCHHISYSQATYGVSNVSTLKRTDHVTMGVHSIQPIAIPDFQQPRVSAALIYLHSLSYVDSRHMDHFTHEFSIIIQIKCKFLFVSIQLLIKWLLQNFAHAMTAMLSWHVSNFVAKLWPGMERQLLEFTIKIDVQSTSC